MMILITSKSTVPEPSSSISLERQDWNIYFSKFLQDYNSELTPDHLDELLLAGVLAHGPQHYTQLLVCDTLAPVLNINGQWEPEQD